MKKNNTKKTTEILWRFSKVAYAVVLLFGLVFGWFIWSESTPYSYDTYSYLVTCDNGKTFDPLSKPIDHDNTFGPNATPDTKFTDWQLRDECNFGTIYFVNGDNLPKNYNLTYDSHLHIISTQEDQTRTTILWVLGFYLLVEIIRRTLLYVFLGRRFMPDIVVV